MAEPRKDDAIKSVQVEALVSLAFLSLRLPTHPLVPVTDMVPGRDDGCERHITRRNPRPTSVSALV